MSQNFHVSIYIPGGEKELIKGVSQLRPHLLKGLRVLASNGQTSEKYSQ
jgi:hypothetical protein